MPGGLAWSISTPGSGTLGRGDVRLVAAVAVELSAPPDLKNSNLSITLFQNALSLGGTESLSAIEPENVTVAFLRCCISWMSLVDTVCPRRCGNRIYRREAKIVLLLDEQQGVVD